MRSHLASRIRDLLVATLLAGNLSGCGAFLVAQPEATPMLIEPQDVRAATPTWQPWPGEEKVTVSQSVPPAIPADVPTSTEPPLPTN